MHFQFKICFWVWLK